MDIQPLEVKLKAFEGPLDLLLHLIKENKVDIFDIPIAEITDQYLVYLKAMKELDLDVSGEFILMAATLLYIKSKMLLPIDQEDEEEDYGIDPRDELVKKLLEYQSFKEAAKELGLLAHERSKVYTRQILEHYTPEITLDASDTDFSANLFDLMQAFSRVLREKSKEVIHEVYEESISIEERVAEIKERLREQDAISFQAFFVGKQSRMELIVTFIAILELAKQKLITIVQAKAFDDILLQKVS